MKNTIIKKIILSMLVLGTMLTVSGQEQVIEGKVTVFDSISVIKAGIEVKSTKEVVYSDTLGKFTIHCQARDKIKVTARGFSTENVKIEEGTKSLQVNLKLKPGASNQELAVGYGHVKDRDKLAAISSIARNTVDFSQYNNIYDAISGRFPGVQISYDNKIIIRGVNTDLTENAALLVVDGSVVNETTFGAINPVDIARIDVVKDGSAAMYGLRGANGVVIVETKTGRSEE